MLGAGGKIETSPNHMILAIAQIATVTASLKPLRQQPRNDNDLDDLTATLLIDKHIVQYGEQYRQARMM